MPKSAACTEAAYSCHLFEAGNVGMDETTDLTPRVHHRARRKPQMSVYTVRFRTTAPRAVRTGHDPAPHPCTVAGRYSA